MMPHSVGIALVLSLWSAFDAVTGVLNYACSRHEPCVRSNLSPWSSCTASCEPGGTRTRVFTCGIGSGLSCTQTEAERCNVNTPCRSPDVDGNWGSWTAWTPGPCSASCCGGTRMRFRTRRCDNPPASGSGAPCPGLPNDSDTQVCNTGQCPLVCSPGDQFFPDTCSRCVRRYYTCAGTPAQPVESFCPEKDQPVQDVWSQQAMACVSPSLCEAIEPR